MGAAGLLCLVALGCSLEEALGVDDGSGSGDPTGQGPGGDAGTSEGSGTGEGSGADTTADGGSSDDGPELPPSCDGRALRVAAYNTETIGTPGSPEFEALAAIVERIDADVICLEEVQYWEEQSLQALADAAGYAGVIQADESPAIGGDHTNACMSRNADFVRLGSWSGRDLSSDPDANDVGRDILVARVNLAQGEDVPCHMGFVSLHLKAGPEELDWFRRQVEVERTVQAVARYRDAYPDDPLVLLGDFNEDIGDPAIGTVFSGPPPADQLPISYQVGNDIEFPLTYQPFTRLEGIGFAIVPATQEDSTRDETWQDAVRLDYVFQDGAAVQGTVVYSACRDDGVDGAPAGAWLPLAGEPLACGMSDQASDHFPVVVDLVLE